MRQILGQLTELTGVTDVPPNRKSIRFQLSFYIVESSMGCHVRAAVVLYTVVGRDNRE